MRLRPIKARTALGLVLVASAIAPVSALARFDLNPASPTSEGVTAAPREQQARFARDGHRLLFVRIEDQIRLVIYGAVPVVELGPNALRIYGAGGLSTAEPDAQAVRFAALGGRRSG